MRESNQGQTVCGTSGYNLGGNSGSIWIVDYYAYVSLISCVFVCVYTSQFMYNKLYFFDLYSPVASFFLCVCVRALVERKRATMNKQYVALLDPTWERTNSGGSFSVCDIIHAG